MRSSLLFLFAITLVACGNGRVNGDPCDQVNCGDHGLCAVAEGEPVCACDPGYHPDGLTCVPDTTCTDADGDGYGTGAGCLGSDCDDSDPARWDDCPGCTDVDGDGRGAGCPSGADCDDNDADNWSSCATCADGDGDGHHTGCDAYTTRDGPDCDDGSADHWDDCGTCVDADGDGHGSGCNLGNDCDDTDETCWTGACCDTTDCTDADGDGYGTGADCLGPDCDDGDPARWDDCAGCTDEDGDGRGAGCPAGADCDDEDVDNWASCATCTDGDGDGHHVGCDAYTTRDGPDCDDGSADHWDDCGTCVDADGDGHGAGCNLGDDCDDADDTIWEGCPDPCDGVDCSGHGTCVVEDGNAVCQCGAGYTGADCSLCAAGYHQEGDLCVADTVGTCDGIDCSGHGTCFEINSAAECRCEPGYHPEALQCVANSAGPCDGGGCNHYVPDGVLFFDGQDYTVAPGDVDASDTFMAAGWSWAKLRNDSGEPYPPASGVRTDFNQDGNLFGWQLEGLDASWDNTPGAGGWRVVLTATAANPAFVAPAGTSFDGGRFNVISMTVAPSATGTSFRGRVYWSTAAHGFEDPYFAEVAPFDGWADCNQWCIGLLRWDMGQVADYISNAITGLRFEIITDAGDAIILDRVAAHDPQGYGGAGYIYTVEGVEGWQVPIPAVEHHRAMCFESFSGTLFNQTDFYVQWGDVDQPVGHLPADVWFQWWHFEEPNPAWYYRGMSAEQKFIYPSRQTNPPYPVTSPAGFDWLMGKSHSNYIPHMTHWPTGGAGMTMSSFDGMTYGEAGECYPSWDYFKPGQADTSIYLAPGEWRLIRMHMNSSQAAQARGEHGWEMFVRVYSDPQWHLVARWIHGQPYAPEANPPQPNDCVFNYVLDNSTGYGHRMFRMPTTHGWLMSENHRYCLSDFAIAAGLDSGGNGEADLPVYDGF